MSITRPCNIGSRWLFLGGAVALMLSCVYDANNRCDENEELYSDGRRCVCVAGAAMTAHGCTLCGAHEVPGMGGCVCADGYVRSSPDAACQATTGALGRACDAQQAPCADATYSHCQITSGTAGYCTSTGCSVAADCVDGY